MPRAGFYNDNEYRAYPFIARLAYSGLTPCPNSTIVDCGFIMGLDSEYDPEEHVVYLYRVTRLSDTFEFEFRTTAPGAVAYPLIFERAVTTPEWASEFVESGVNTETAVCLTEPAWEGYLVTGVMVELLNLLPGDGSVQFFAPTISIGADHEVEPARIQSLVRAYVRSINVGNYARIYAADCDSAPSSPGDIGDAPAERAISVNATCLTGAVQFKAGFNCIIQQAAYNNTLTVIARKYANTANDPDSELCQYGSELPLYVGEAPVDGSQFLSGGAACEELIASINGITGKHVNIVAGVGVTITLAAADTLVIGLNPTVINQNC